MIWQIKKFLVLDVNMLSCTAKDYVVQNYIQGQLRQRSNNYIQLSVKENSLECVGMLAVVSC